jgi:hypothetical protein
MKRIVTMVCILMVSVWIGNLPLPAEARHAQSKPKRHDCSAYGKVKWTSWKKGMASLYFKNRTQSDVIISYIDFSGKKRRWGRQPTKPGRGFYTRTFLTLPWIVETTKGDCLGIWEATQANRIGWITIIKPESAGIRHACAKQAQLKFKYQWDLLKLEITNKTSKEHALYIVWQGKRWPAKKPWAKIPPGATYKQPTYPTLPWIVVDDKDQCVGIWEADALVSRVTLKPKAGKKPPPLLDGVPLGYLHYKEQAVLTAGQAFPTIPPTPDGGLVYLGICVASNAQRSVPPEVLLPDTNGIKQGWGQEQVYRGPQHERIQGTVTNIGGHVIAVRQGGDFDCGPMEKDWGRYVSQKGKKSIVPGTSKKLTLVVDVDSDRAGKRQPNITKQAHAGDMSRNHPAFKDWTLYQAKKGTHTPYEIIDFSDAFKDPNNAGRKRLPAVAKPGSDGTANAYVSCAQVFFNPRKPQAGCGIGIVVKAVNAGTAYTKEISGVKQPARGLGYLPADGDMGLPTNIKSGLMANGKGYTRAFADRPDDPANQVKDAFRVHAIYVLPQDFKDHYLDLPTSKDGGIPALLTAMNQHFKKQSIGNQEFRLDMIKGSNQPDVSFLRLGKTDKEVFTGSNSPFDRGRADKSQPYWFDVIAKAVNAAGFNHPRKMYAVFYPGNSDVCGIASAANIGITTSCRKSGKREEEVFFSGGTYLHELFHNLGYIPPCAPNQKKAHSLVPYDTMHTASHKRGNNIDKGRTDYYGHKNACKLDLSKSVFLTPSPKPLAQLPPSWKVNYHCIYRGLGPYGKVCSVMTASDFNTSGAGGGSGTGASTQSSGGQINTAKAGIQEVNEPGRKWEDHSSYFRRGSASGSSSSSTSGAGSQSSTQAGPPPM